jgi:polar amino acid transport system substrate-binding protein
MRCNILIKFSQTLPILILLITWNLKANEIQVLTEYFAPYQTESITGELTGFSVDVVKAMYEQLNSELNIQIMPWARAYITSLHEPNVLIFSIVRTKEREEKFHWVGDLFEEQLYFWGLKNKFTEEFKQNEQLKTYRIAALRDSNIATYLSHNNYTKTHLLINAEQNLQMLFGNRVDLIIATKLTVKKRTEELGLDFNLLVHSEELTQLNNPLSIALSKTTSDNIVKQYQTAFKQVVDQGTLSKLQHKWKIIND